jgi:hypothetical protein
MSEKMQSKQLGWCLTMRGPPSDMPPLAPILEEGLWHELETGGASEEARQDALGEISSIVNRFRRAHTRDQGPRTKHRDEAEAIVAALEFAHDTVSGAGKRVRALFYAQLGKGHGADRVRIGKRKFRVFMREFTKAALGALKKAQVRRGRLPAQRELSDVFAHAAYVWQRYTGNKFVATNKDYSKKPILGSQIRFLDLVLGAADANVDDALRERLLKKGQRRISRLLKKSDLPDDKTTTI